MKNFEYHLWQLSHMHLQWFAAEDEGRTEAPTERKRRKAREEGKVARSADLSASIVLLCLVVLLGILAPYFLTVLVDMMRYFIGGSAELSVQEGQLIWAQAYRYLASIVAPIVIIAFLAALVGNILQVGFLFATKPIALDIKKIVPHFGQYLKKIFFSVEGLYNVSRLFIKVGIVAFLCYLNVRGNFSTFAGFMTMPFTSSFLESSNIIFVMLMQVGVVMLLFAIIDYAFQRYQQTEQLKMTREEVKEERKSEEGDPHVRRRLRQRVQELLDRTSLKKIPQADVVVTNPTHYSVALQYDVQSMEAPMVTAKGIDHLALRIRRVAEGNDVPIIENRVLARGLYHEIDVGSMISQKYYEAMVTVLKEVYRMRKPS